MEGSTHQDKRNKKTFISIYWEGKRYRIFRHPLSREPFLPEKSTRKQLSRTQTEVDEGTFNPKSWIPDSPLSMKVYCQEWLKNIDVTQKALIGYKTAVNKHIVSFFENKDIRHIRYNNIANFKRSQLL